MLENLNKIRFNLIKKKLLNVLHLVLHFTTCSSYSFQIKPSNQELKPITRTQTQQPNNSNPDHQDINENKKKKPKFNTSEIIKPSTIRSTTNQDHRILHVLHQILTQSTPNSQQIKLINLINKPTQIKKPITTNPEKHNQTQTNTIKPKIKPKSHHH